MGRPLRHAGTARRGASPGARRLSSGRAGILGSLAALLAASLLAACSTEPEPELTFTPPPASAQDADTALADRLDAAPDLTIAGESLDVPRLRQFYGHHGFTPVWTDRPEQAESLRETVLHAEDQGLDPVLFHGALLRRGTPLSPIDRDLVLTDAVLSYEDALARGAVPVERRLDNEALTPEPVDVVAVLDGAVDSPDAGAAILALAPTTPTYDALLDALKQVRSTSRAHDAAAAARVRTIAVNLERQRWLPRAMPADRAWVNVADQRLTLYRADQSVFSTRVVVGEDVKHNQSPEFQATIDASLFDPPWVIPSDIVTNEILPKISHDPTYLAKNHMIMLASGEAEQLPGPDAGLGLIMFDMPNRFDVYLHDTPDRQIFNLNNRRISHGCIRVQNPREFAALLMQEPIDAINDGIAAGNTTRHALPTPVPVFVVYETAFVDGSGTLQFRPDFYDRDAEIWQLLQTRGKARPATTARAHGSPDGHDAATL